MGTPANALDITEPGLVKFDGVNSFAPVTTTNHATLVGSTNNGITGVGPTATAGQVLQSGGPSANPSYSTATYPSTAGSSGKVLISDGTNFVDSTATFPATAGTTGTILRSDGTNWVATTTTYPNTNAISTLVYASAANVLGALATANNGLLVTSNSGVPSILAGPGATGRVLQSNASAAPSFSTATYPSTGGTTGTVLRSDGTNFVNSTAFTIGSTGIMTNTAQPAFSAYLNTSVANVTGDNTVYTVVCDTELFDQGGNFASGIFTAPVTGKYLFTYSIAVYSLVAGHNAGSAQLVTTAMTFSPNVFAPVYLANANGVGSVTASVIVPMTASDTARIKVIINNSTKTVGVLGVDGGGITYTTFSGSLIC